MTAHRPHDPAAATTAAAAARLTGTPADMAKRLRALLDEGAPKANPRESADARRDREAEVVAHEGAVAAHRHRLAGDFAEAHGWRPTFAPLSTKEVARRAFPGGNWHRRANEWSAYLPHGTFYRGEDNRVAAAVGHPTAELIEGNPLLVEMWAAEQGLALSLPDFPSWQHPGRTRLVLFTSAEALQPAAPVSSPAASAVSVPVGQPPAVAVDTDQAARPRAGDQAGTLGGSVIGSAPDAAPPTAPDLDALRLGAPLEPDDAEPDDVPTVGLASDPVAKIDIAPAAPAPTVMRPIVRIDLAGVAPRDLTGEVGPDFDIVAPADLLVDEAYQRNLGPRNLDLIRRIVAGWSWSKFKPPICTRVDDRLHVLDGQHTAIAAATHGGIPMILVVVVPVPEVADRAAAFVSHATNRLQATALQIQRAALVAGDAEAVTLDGVCRAAGVELLPFAPSDGGYAARQTVAVVGLRRLVAKRGSERATEILGALAAADLAPIAGDHIRLGEVLLCDPAYAEGFDAEKLTAAMRGLSAKTHAEARELAIAQRLPAWRALAAVMARNSRAAAGRRRASA